MSLFEFRMHSLKCAIVHTHAHTHTPYMYCKQTHSLPASALSLCGRLGPELSQPASLIAAGAAILPCFIYEPSQQRDERGAETGRKSEGGIVGLSE